MAEANFNDLALSLFHYQAAKNPVYKEYLNLLKIKPDQIQKVDDIPFLPVQVFKNHKVYSGNQKPELVFESSRTTGIPSLHYVMDASIYKESIEKCFQLFFGNPQDFVFLALLPSYMERPGSSLIFMVNYLMQLSGQSLSGYFLTNFEQLYQRINLIISSGKRVFLIGVAYALLDFNEVFNINLSGHIIMETGGMKGRRKEIIRQDLHAALKKSFNLESIVSEYGMTEMLSQAYALKNGFFDAPPWLKFKIREVNDPFSLAPQGQPGGINVIDLANIDSCAFIALQDLGRQHSDGTLEVLGRMDNSEIRGCSQMYL